MTRDRRVLIAPVGLYVARVLKGITTYRPDLVYLLTQEGAEWEGRTKQNADSIARELGTFYRDNLKAISVDFTSFSAVFTKVNDIVAKEKAATEVLIDVTSTPRLSQVAILNVASIHPNVVVYYTPARSPATPEMYKLGIVDIDEGTSPVEIPVVRSLDFSRLKSEKYGEVLKALQKKGDQGVRSHKELLSLMKRDTSSKAEYMKLGRVLDDLQYYGYVEKNASETNRKEEGVNLTIAGKALASVLAG